MIDFFDIGIDLSNSDCVANCLSITLRLFTISMNTLAESETQLPGRYSRKSSWPLVKDPQAIVYYPQEDKFSTEDQAVLERRKTTALHSQNFHSEIFR